jgi:subtilisin-like proprotein convertase family protein
MKKMIITLSIICIIPGVVLAQDYTFWEHPNLAIPLEDTLGTYDTLIIEQNAIINDINIYIGIDTHNMGNALIIKLISPWQDTVYLANRNVNRRYLNCWFDTEQVEDGPGQLEDFAGHSIQGQWILHLIEPAGHVDFILSRWAIEVYRENSQAVDGPIQPEKFGILSVYPNPFNSSVKICFGIETPGQTTLKVYNILGEEVTTLVNSELPSAEHSVTWNANGVPSGVYFYELKSQGRTDKGRVTLIK